MADDLESKAPRGGGKSKPVSGEVRGDAEREREREQTGRPGVEQGLKVEADQAALRRAAARQSKDHQI